MLAAPLASVSVTPSTVCGNVANVLCVLSDRRVSVHVPAVELQAIVAAGQRADVAVGRADHRGAGVVLVRHDRRGRDVEEILAQLAVEVLPEAC